MKLFYYNFAPQPFSSTICFIHPHSFENPNAEPPFFLTLLPSSSSFLDRLPLPSSSAVSLLPSSSAIPLKTLRTPFPLRPRLSPVVLQFLHRRPRRFFTTDLRRLRCSFSPQKFSLNSPELGSAGVSLRSSLKLLCGSSRFLVAKCSFEEFSDSLGSGPAQNFVTGPNQTVIVSLMGFGLVTIWAKKKR